MDYKIIDTNVPLAAIDDAIPVACRLICVRLIGQILKGEIGVVIDEQGQALDEYRRQMIPDPRPDSPLSGQFLMYLHNHQYDVSRVRRVPLERDESGAFVAYPKNAAVQDFDLSDKKWVAIYFSCLSHVQLTAPIYNATDSDWLHFQAAFTKLGVQIVLLCPEILKDV